MKKYSSQIVLVVLCVLLVISLMRISSFERQIERMENNIQNQLQQVSNNISNISTNVSYALQEQNKLIHGYDISYGAVDTQAHTVQTKLSVQPKTYTEGVTEVIFCSKDTQYTATLQESGEYSVELTIPIFSETVVDTVQFIEGDIVKTEPLSCTILPVYYILPSIYAYSGGSTISHTNATVSYTGEIEIIIEGVEKDTLQRVDIVEYLNHEEQARTPVSLNATTSQSDTSTLAPEPEWEGERTVLYTPFEKSLKLDIGDSYEVCVEVVDQYGFLHIVYIDTTSRDAEGNFDYGENKSEQASIYDSTRKVIYIP